MPKLPHWIDAREVHITAIRAQGAGGQNINKVSNAVHLRFAIATSSLPDTIKNRLLQLRDQRITADGVVVIKAQSSRSLEQNKAQAMERLQALIASVAQEPTLRKPTRPSRASQRQRLQGKALRGRIKAARTASWHGDD